MTVHEPYFAILDTQSHKPVYPDGYKKSFSTQKGQDYEISVKDSELYIDWGDHFESVFEFRKDVLEQNNLLDVIIPEQIESHKDIGMDVYDVYILNISYL